MEEVLVTSLRIISKGKLHRALQFFLSNPFLQFRILYLIQEQLTFWVYLLNAELLPTSGWNLSNNSFFASLIYLFKTNYYSLCDEANLFALNCSFYLFHRSACSLSTFDTPTLVFLWDFIHCSPKWYILFAISSVHEMIYTVVLTVLCLLCTATVKSHGEKETSELTKSMMIRLEYLPSNLELVSDFPS
jgi:hypothetical protein